MTANSKDDFLACLKASKVIVPEQLEEALADIDSDDPRQIAIALVRRELLTKWQAKYLVAGHSRLHVGNYQLLERLRRNEFGDRFLAVHEQLDRLVEIQILPKSLNDQQDLREKFLSSASVASQVDHPNLVHVYDIDQEGKRLYLVVEHTVGKLLSSFDSTKFSTMDVARLVEQSLKGLKAAHEKGIVHGLINKHNVIVTDAEQIKIQNLVMASLENPNHATATQAEDIQAVGKLGHELLDGLEANNKGRQELAAIIEAVESTESVDVTEIRGQLESWITQHDQSSTQTLISGIGIETTLIDGAKPTTPANSTDPSDLRETVEPISELSFLQRQNPVAVVGIAATICLLTLGGVAWLAYSINQSKPVAKKTTVMKPMTNSETVSIEQERANPNPAGKPSRSPALLESSGESLKFKPLTDEEIKAEVEKIGGDQNALSMTAVSAETADDRLEAKLADSPAESAPAIDSLPVEPASASATSEEKTKAIDLGNAPEKSPQTELARPAAMAGKPETVDDEKVEGSVSRDFEKPFVDFPRYAELGDIADASPQEIGKVYLPPNILMGLEIVSGDAISRSKCVFELERATNDRQRWFANFRKRKSSPAVKVGEFFKEGDTFYFRWEPTAAEDDDHNYLRNCALKLVGNDEKITFLNLRTPIEIEGLAITQEGGIAKVETDIQWLPDPDSLKIEVIPLPYTGIPKSFMFPPDRQIQKRQPVIVFFSEQEKDRFFYLQVSADVRKTLKLQSALMFNALDGSSPVVADPKLIEAVADRITRLAVVTNADYEQIKVADRPSDIKYDDFEELKKGYKKAAETAQAQKVTLLEYANILPALYGKTIPLRVYFEMDNMQIELATSAPNQ